MRFRFVGCVLPETSLLDLLLSFQNFIIRVNAQEDDGALNANTTNMLSRMVANMPLFIRVRTTNLEHGLTEC